MAFIFRHWLWGLLASALLSALAVQTLEAASLDREAAKAFRKIGISAEQADAYSKLYDDFLRSRASQVRREMKNRTGSELPVMAKKKAQRAARKSVKKMRAVLSELQLKYYEEYLDLANQIFLRDAGLR